MSLGFACWAALSVLLGANRVLSTAARSGAPAETSATGAGFGACALGAALFTLALCYKQMSLYLALAFFALLAALALRLACRSLAAGFAPISNYLYL